LLRVQRSNLSGDRKVSLVVIDGTLN